MGDKTGIIWTDATWNCLRGCSRVSRGCMNCYAERQAVRMSGVGGAYEGLVRSTTGGPRWTGEVRLIPGLLELPLRWTKPRLVFANSMSDVFHEAVSFETIAGIFGVMAAASEHTFQVLTKRPARMLEFFSWLREEVWPDLDGPNYRDTLCSHAANLLCDGSNEDQDKWFWKLRDLCSSPAWPLPHVWLGVSVEDQRSTDERVPLLLQAPAALRFVSAEPLLGPVAFGEGLFPDWLIVGGESGPGARWCDPLWVRDLILDCREADVPVLVKQLGAMWAQHEESRDGVKRHSKGGELTEWRGDLRVQQWPKGVSR